MDTHQGRTHLNNILYTSPLTHFMFSVFRPTKLLLAGCVPGSAGRRGRPLSVQQPPSLTFRVSRLMVSIAMTACISFRSCTHLVPSVSVLSTPTRRSPPATGEQRATLWAVHSCACEAEKERLMSSLETTDTLVALRVPFRPQLTPQPCLSLRWCSSAPMPLPP